MRRITTALVAVLALSVMAPTQASAGPGSDAIELLLGVTIDWTPNTDFGASVTVTFDEIQSEISGTFAAAGATSNGLSNATIRKTDSQTVWNAFAITFSVQGGFDNPTLGEGTYQVVVSGDEVDVEGSMECVKVPLVNQACADS